jgi:hypothetical protein
MCRVLVSQTHMNVNPIGLAATATPDESFALNLKYRYFDIDT